MRISQIKNSILNHLLVAAFLPAVLFAAGGAREAIEAANREFSEAHLKGDAKTIAQQYTRDAHMIMDEARGRADIEKTYVKLLGGGGKEGKLETVEVQEMGDWAYEVGNLKVTDAPGQTTTFRYLCVWKKEDGQWRIHRDCGAPAAAGEGKQALTEELKLMEWQLGTWAADTEDPKGKWQVSFTPALGGKIVEIVGTWSDGKKVQHTMKGTRFFDKRRGAVVTQFVNSDGGNWEQIGTISEGRTDFRETSPNEKGQVTSFAGIDVRIDADTYHNLSLGLNEKGEMEKKPAWVHKRVK